MSEYLRLLSTKDPTEAFKAMHGAIKKLTF